MDWVVVFWWAWVCGAVVLGLGRVYMEWCSRREPECNCGCGCGDCRAWDIEENRCPVHAEDLPEARVVRHGRENGLY